METLINTFRNPSTRILIIYIVVSGLWIFGSDWVLANFINEFIFLGIDMISVLKGVFFVVVTGWLFYKLIDRNFKWIQDSEERYRKLVENLPEVIVVHIEGEIVYINEAGVKFAEAKNDQELIGKDILDFVPPEEYDYTIARINKVQKEGRSELREQNIILPNGRYVPVEITAFQTTYQGKNAVQVIVRDITERKQSEAKINYLAYYDTTTGLPNRNQLNEYLKDKIKHSKSFSVMLLDLDRFKVINDNFGHDIGDLLLAQVSKRLSQCAEKESFLSRYGGDEYVIILESAAQKAISQTVEKMIDELSSPFHIKGNEMYITPSIGISVYPKDGDSIESLIKNADTAMYAAKEEGRNGYHFYDLKLHKKNQRKMQLEQNLRKAVEHNELTLYYQPQVDLNTDKLVGIEALIRWHHPKLGFISPLEFIPIAEETGQIIRIGEWILKTACTEVKELQRKGFSSIQLAVNVSVKQFRDHKFLEMVNEVLKETELDPHYLELEITESIVQDIEESIGIINNLKALGIKIAIDDFGTGYSSLSVLNQLPIDNLKIDKSFIKESNENGEALVKTIIQMGHNLNFILVAEGVEYEEQVTFLKKNHCHVGQGYFFSKPLPIEELEKMLKEKHDFYR